MANKKKLLELIDLAALGADAIGLEIGPSFDPVVSRRDGHNVEILDHLSADDLRAKYKDAPNVNLALIEEVNYVSDGCSILELIGKPGHYDYIVASHVIEHTVDFLGFLLDCQHLLKASGRLVLAVPDMRFSFDCLRSLSTTGQVLQAHVDKAKRHSIGNVFDEMAYNCQRDGAIAWQRNAGGTLTFFRPLSDAKWITEQYMNGDMFLDIHAWQFTPSSFRLILNDLGELGLLELHEKLFDEASENEFFVVLSKNATGCAVSRIVLAERTLMEQRAIIAAKS